MITIKILLGIIVCIGIYLIYKQQQISLLKKYPPGSGKIITTKWYFYHSDPKNVKYFRVLRRWKESKGRDQKGSIGYEYYQECEIWE